MARQHTIDTVKEALITGYVKKRRAMTVDELASASGYGAETIRKMHLSGEMPWADDWKTTVSIGGAVRKRLVFEPTKVALAAYIQETCHA